MSVADPGAGVPRRIRRDRSDLREQLLDSALIEFAAHGYDGASTLSIARHVGAHQPQINYHFDSKESLWKAAVDHLFAQLAAALAPEPSPSARPAEPMTDDIASVAVAFADTLRRFVRFVAAHPELNRIITHEATTHSPRLEWMTERHVRSYAEAIQATWTVLVDAGIAAPIDARLIHHVLVGAASLVFVNAPEFELLVGESPTSDAWIDRHADGLVQMLLPGTTAP